MNQNINHEVYLNENFWKLAVTSLAVLCLAACQQNGKSSHCSAEKDKTPRLGEDFEMPILHVYNPSIYGPRFAGEGLGPLRRQWEIEPALAESWKVSADGKTYTFNEENKVSDGSDFNAANVKRNFDTIFSKENKGNHEWFSFTNVLDSYKVVDDHTFEITLKKFIQCHTLRSFLIRRIRFLVPASDGDDTTKNKSKYSIGTLVNGWSKIKKSNEYITFT